MNIYLFEIDSVRRSEKEIEVGERALFEEVLLNGNTVVFSLNQIADSMLFLYLMGSDKTYQIVKRLFQLGYFKIAEMSRITTASQYIQGKLKDEDFIFSGIINNNNKLKREEVYNALKYADTSIFDKRIAECTDKSEEKFQLEALKRYIEIILRISLARDCRQPEKDDQTSLNDLIARFVEYEQNEGVKSIYEGIVGNSDHYALNRRSWWHKQLKNNETLSLDDRKNMIAIVDLSYNYLIEKRINGISCHYFNNEELIEDYKIRKEEYLKSHDFSLSSDSHVNYNLKCDWSFLLQICECIHKYKQDKRHSVTETKPYKKQIAAQKKNRIKQVLICLVLSFVSSFWYVILFLILQYCSNKMQNGITEMISSVQFNLYFTTAVLILLFSLGSSIFLKILRIPDILEDIREVLHVNCLCVRFMCLKANKLLRSLV